jgi:glucose dehydrogenase
MGKNNSTLTAQERIDLYLAVPANHPVWDSVEVHLSRGLAFGTATEKAFLSKVIADLQDKISSLADVGVKARLSKLVDPPKLSSVAELP